MKKFLIGFLIFALVVLMFPAVINAAVLSVEITAPTTYLVSGIVEIKGSIKMSEGQHHYWFAVVDSKGTEIAVSKTVDVDIGGPFTITSSFNWVWDTTLVPNGIYTIILEATDGAGNSSIAQHEVEVDNVLPEEEPTKSDILMNSGVPGKGLENAPGLQKPFNPNSQADEHAGMK